MTQVIGHILEYLSLFGGIPACSQDLDLHVRFLLEHSEEGAKASAQSMITALLEASGATVPCPIYILYS